MFSNSSLSGGSLISDLQVIDDGVYLLVLRRVQLDGSEIDLLVGELLIGPQHSLVLGRRVVDVTESIEVERVDISRRKISDPDGEDGKVGKSEEVEGHPVCLCGIDGGSSGGQEHVRGAERNTSSVHNCTRADSSRAGVVDSATVRVITSASNERNLNASTVDRIAAVCSSGIALADGLALFVHNNRAETRLALSHSARVSVFARSVVSLKYRVAESGGGIASARLVAVIRGQARSEESSFADS